MILVGLTVDQFVLPFIVSMTPTIAVPGVIGKASTDGQTILSSAGLRVAQVREQYSESTPAGRIMSQLPYPGATVKEGRRAYITVSKGIEHLQVPNVIGSSVRDARMSLMRSGLLLGTQSSRPDANAPVGTIVSQSYAPGTKVQRETIVDVVVSLGNGSPIPDVVGLSITEAQEVLSSMGFTVGPIVHRASNAFESGTVLSQSPSADSSLPTGTMVTLIIAK